MLEVALLTLTQRLAADDVLGRVYGVEKTLFVVATGVGSIAAAGLVGVLGGKGALVATGLILPVIAVAFRRRLGAFEAAAKVPERAFTLLRGLPIFAPLPIATVENLALRAGTERFAAGAPVVTQGHEADRFYVIDEGTVDVHEDGVYRRHESVGEYFGEIALLRSCPRTATVRATTPATLLTLNRDEFLAGIGSHTRSTREAENVAAARLRGPPGAPQ